ncbi:hypothetical protein K9M16_02260 [Candidatus Babeliales bacterium]|nr:hypothetical protein [Candidatus Babeliales bacterium]
MKNSIQDVVVVFLEIQILKKFKINLKKRESRVMKNYISKSNILFLFFNLLIVTNFVCSQTKLDQNYVDQTCLLNNFEQNYNLDRKNKVIKENLINFLKQNKIDTNFANKQDFKCPNIAFCLSGGGYRAMISSLGFMLGMQKTNLLNTAMHISSLSGSTWLVAPMMVRNMNPQDYKPVLREKVKDSLFDISSINFDAILLKIIKHFLSGQDIQFVDLYGAVLVDRLLGDFGKSFSQSMTFKNIQNTMKLSNKYPYPLFTAAITPELAVSRTFLFDRNIKGFKSVTYTSDKKRKRNKYNYEWMEINPFNSGSDFLNGFIDTQYFGSYFDMGMCKRVSPEISLGSFLGLFGSAYSMSIGDVLKFLSEKMYIPFLNEMVNFITSQANMLKGRLFPADYNNFTYNMLTSPYKFIDELILEDAGFAFGLPIPPLLKKERKIDIIIVCDAGENAQESDFGELKDAAFYAWRKNLKFPDITKPTKIGENFAIFQDSKDTEVPTVIYFSNSKELDFSTLKFEYSNEEFENLCNFMQDTVINYSSDIAQVVLNKTLEINAKS